MNYHNHDDDEYYEDDSFMESIPGSDRTRVAPMPTPFVDALCTQAHRVLDRLDRDGSLIELFNSWDADQIIGYERAVTAIAEINGEPVIDEDHVANDGSIPKDI